MLFNSLAFAKFFALTFGASWVLARARTIWPRTIFLLLASYFFYAYSNWRYAPLIFASSTVDFFLARAVHRASSPRRKKLLLLGTVVLNLGFLGYFKYWNFAAESVAWAQARMSLTPSALALVVKDMLPPVGISFFTFESMSYVIDVYRGDLEPCPSYFRYLLFVSFFPHVVAGPIVRPRDLLPQLARRPELTREESGEALFLIATGLLKKLVLADQLGLQIVDRVFDRPTSFSALECLCAVYGYAIQIYCDFSGYTDIAIGVALLFGVRFPKNFDSPYQSTNIAEFWRRWHISLSTWLRDYLYIPLGGNREGEVNTYRNLMLTMVLGGLWHGAKWTFVFWGFLHGLGLAATRFWQRRRGRAPGEAAPLLRILAGIFTFHWVCLAWVFFRAPTFRAAKAVLAQIATRTTFHPNLNRFVLGLLAIGFFTHLLPEDWVVRVRRTFAAMPAPLQGAALFCVAIALHEAASAQAIPFVYFQF